MGTIQHEIVIVEIHDFECKPSFYEYFDVWLDQTVKEDYQRNLFIRFENSYSDEFLLMMPDGSKEGWNKSNDCDVIREEFLRFLDTIDNQIFCRVVHLSFGELSTRIKFNSGE